MSPTVANILRAAVLVAWVVALAWLLQSGAYKAYLPKLWPLIAMGLACTAILVVGLFGRALRSGAAGEGVVRTVRLGLMMLPLVYIVAAPAQGLDSHAFERRRVGDQLAPATPPKQAEAPAPVAAATGASGEPRVLTLMDVQQMAREIAGTRIVTEGMVYHDAKLPPGHLVLFRFSVTCCAADAVPVGALVKCDEPARYKQDDWVRVTGELQVTKLEGQEGALLVAEKVDPIAAPTDEYLSPFDAPASEF